jgi:hypothetical protein
MVGAARVRALAIVAFVFSLCACSSVDAPRACLTGKPAVETQLYFGLSRSNGAVSPRQWQDFVAHEIAPRFREGFTVMDGRGFWLSEAAKRTISENSKVLIRVHDGSAKENEAIDTIIESYKHAFAQESVLRVDRGVCAAF